MRGAGPDARLRWAMSCSTFAREALGFDPDPEQCAVLDARKSVLLNCHRQWGKSTVASIRVVHSSLFRENWLSLVIAPSERQSKLLFSKVADWFRVLDQPPKFEEDNKTSCILSNRSRIIALPGSAHTVRGFSAVNELIIDEAAYVPDSIYAATSPMLAMSKGLQLDMTTPNGKNGAFYNKWASSGDSRLRIEANAENNPRISKDFLREERRQMGEWYYQQEYLCQFVENVSNVFKHDDIRGALDTTVAPLFSVSA